MYIIIAGGGKVGNQLARDLITDGHEVTVLEANHAKASSLEDELGAVVLGHDASEGRWLIEAGIARADLVIAVTGHDEDNIIICQMADPLSEGKARTIARINNPKNSDTFRLLGIEALVDATDLVMSMIERDVSTDSVVHLMRLQSAGLELIEVTVGQQSSADGATPDDLGLPERGARICVVLRDHKPLIPLATARLKAGDSVILFAQTEDEVELRKQFLGAPT